MNILAASAVIEATWVAQTILTGRLSPDARAWGWAVGILNMLLWIVFGIWTGGYFFAVCAVAGIIMYARNLLVALA